MTPSEKPAVETVACEVCLKEVPISAAKTAEAVDYVMNFCGLACYEQWLAKKANGDKESAGKQD